MSFEEQLMSKDKYQSIFSFQMEAIIILQIFFATRAVLKIGGYSRISPSFSWGILAENSGGDVRHTSQNFYPIYDQNLQYSLSYLKMKPWSQGHFPAIFVRIPQQFDGTTLAPTPYLRPDQKLETLFITT